MKLQSVGLQRYQKEIPAHMFSCEYWKKLRQSF